MEWCPVPLTRKEKSVTSKLVLPLRQQRLAFAENDLWDKLPQDMQVKCQHHLSRLLATIINHDRSERKHEDERKDTL